MQKGFQMGKNSRIPSPRGRARVGVCKKTAFTLAEVLITLGVIGVVAAITISNIYSQYRFYILKKQYQKSYSNLNQAFKLAVEDYGTTPKCYYQSYSISRTILYGNVAITDCGEIKKLMLKKLHILKSCNKPNSPDCVPTYKNVANPFNANELQSYYILNDNTIILNPYDSFPRYFAIDVNGANGPNKWGYDVFALMIISTGNFINLVPYHSGPVEAGGKNHQDFLYK